MQGRIYKSEWGDILPLPLPPGYKNAQNLCMALKTVDWKDDRK